MLRLFFVLAIVGGGTLYAVRHPFYALLLYVWYAYFRPETWVWHGDLIGGLHLSYAFAVLVIVSSLLRRDVAVSRAFFHPLMILVLLFTGQGLLSTWLSEYQSYAWSYWIEFFKSVVMTCLIVALVDDRAKLRALLIVIAFSLGFEGAKQGWAELVRNPGAPNNNPIPFLGDNNGVAVGMFMLIPVFAALARTTGNAWARWLCLIFMFGILYRGLTTYSRGGFLACLALGVMYWFRSPRKLRVVLGMALVAGLLAVVLPSAFWDRMETIRSYHEVEETSAQGRLHFWRMAVDMAASRPLVGIGFGAYNAAYDAYDSSQGVYGKGRSVHSAWFGVLAETGYPGLLLYVLVLAFAFRNCRRVQRLALEGEGDGELAAYGAALEAAFVVYFVGGTFLPHQYNEMAWHWVALSVALLDVTLRAVGEPRPAPEGESLGWSEAPAAAVRSS